MRIALGLQYNGAAFSGWQTQPGGNTVQDYLEKALLDFVGDSLANPIKTITAGRTDAGVHALGQVIHFDTDINRPMQSWVKGVNAFLPKSMAVVWAREVTDDFDARFSAFERTYCYALLTSSYPAPLVHERAGCLLLPEGKLLDVEAMQAAKGCLIGEHDFSSFRSSECQSKTPVKTIYGLEIVEEGPWIYFVIKGNAFLHHMVRNLVGSLLTVGLGKESPDWLKMVLDAKNRQLAAPTFMADGLYLARVGYPSHFGIPEPNLANSFLPRTLFK